jgi:hypothetical protein
MTPRRPDDTVERRGFAPSARRRNRIAAGVALAALAVGGNILVYSTLNSGETVLQAVVDVPAGAQITDDMLRNVDVDVDSTVNVIDSDDVASVVGQFAKVRIVAGALLTSQSIQAAPLVAPGASVVAIQVKEGSLPVGLRERVPVQLVIPPTIGEGDVQPLVVAGTVVALPSTPTDAIGTQSVSVEVAAGDAATVAAADDVRVVLSEPILSAPVAPEPSHAAGDD